MRKRIALGLAVLLPTLLLAGCTDPNKAKEELQTYLAKKSEVTKYTFKGDADIELGSIPPATDANPITASLLSMFINGKMEWSGASSIDPVRLEATLKSTPAAASTTLELPMLIKDNKMYVSFPLVSKKDEYYLIDMDKLNASGSKTILTPDTLKSITALTGSLADSLIGDIQGKWVKKTENGATFPDGSKGSQFTVDITDKNKQELTDIIRKQFPTWIDSLQSKGALTAEQTSRLKQKTISLEAPGKLTIAVDAQGYIRDEAVQLPYTETDSSGITSRRHLNVHQSYEQINQDIKFEKDVPQQVKPFEDILRLLGNQNK